MVFVTNDLRIRLGGAMSQVQDAGLLNEIISVEELEQKTAPSALAGVQD